MRNRFTLISLTFIVSTLFDASFAQGIARFPGNAAFVDSLVAVYRTGFGNAERFYTGTQYLGYVNRPKGYPFFLSDQAMPGVISYDGAEYADSLLYDLVTDAVIIKIPKENYNIALVNDKIKWFAFSQHKFVRLEDHGAGQIDEGYYELLYDGRLQAFVRHKKQINSRTMQSEVQSEYVQYDTYLIKAGEQYFRVSNNKSLLEALSKHKNEVRRFMHENELDFRKDPVKIIRKAVEYYDQINK